ncbi:hypothetical protein HDZ31DRAFT_19515, partial [Schizophyllum fasciatum]
GRQKYSAYHICKHLVRAVAPLPISFWIEIHRRRTAPLYRHRSLVPLGTTAGAYLELEAGSISDGDDCTWASRQHLLED